MRAPVALRTIVGWSSATRPLASTRYLTTQQVRPVADLIIAKSKSAAAESGHCPRARVRPGASSDKRLGAALLPLPHGSASPRLLAFRKRNTSRRDKLTLLRQDHAARRRIDSLSGISISRLWSRVQSRRPRIAEYACVGVGIGFLNTLPVFEHAAGCARLGRALTTALDIGRVPVFELVAADDVGERAPLPLLPGLLMTL